MEAKIQQYKKFNVDINTGDLSIEADKKAKEKERWKIHPAKEPLLSSNKENPLGYGYELFIEGSKQEDSSTGVAFVVLLHGQKVYESTFKLNDEASVFMAEAMAIEKALEFQKTTGIQGPFYSDSRSALQAICGTKNTLQQVERTRILANELEARLRWVLAHVGTVGNELADTAAKHGAQKNSVDIDVGIPIFADYGSIEFLHISD